MSCAQGGAASVSGSTLTFNPTIDFRPGETVFTTVTTAALSAGGVALTRPWVQQFTTPAGKFMLSIFASLAEYDRESILEKTKAGQQLAAAQGKHIGRPNGLDAENLAKVRKALEKGLSVTETVELTGICLSSVKRYRKHLQAALS